MARKLSVKVRFAELKDLRYCAGCDFKHVSKTVLRSRIREKAVIIAETCGKPAGYLRLEYIWLKIPYVSIISVDKEYRRKGIGTKIIHFTERWLSRHGHTALYSSSQANEPEPQTWHRRIGFEECGFIAGINEKGIGEIFSEKNSKRTADDSGAVCFESERSIND